MTEATLTFRVEEELKSAFTDAAKASDRTSAQLLRGFMRDFVASQRDRVGHDDWFRKQVQLGLDSANAGRLSPAAEVEAEFEAMREKDRKAIAAAT